MADSKNSFGWVSILVSLYFIVRGIIYLSNDTPIWGGIMLTAGVVGLIWKVVDLNKSSES